MYLHKYSPKTAKIREERKEKKNVGGDDRRRKQVEYERNVNT
jgi:hypothetical protein